MKRVGFFYFEEKNNDCRRQRMMKVLIVIMMAGMWCMQPEKASAADPVIRVLLTTTDFNSRYHQEITVSYDGKEVLSDLNFSVDDGGRSEKTGG